MTATASIRTKIIPDRVTICATDGPAELDRKAICIFAATGFFLGTDTYYRNEVALQPATEYELGGDGRIQAARRYWNWHHTPRSVSLSQATDEFAHLFERITREQTDGRDVILPLSGGLDSRSQACALRGAARVRTYSYGFESSFDETKYGAQIAKVNGWRFEAFKIPRGYLWDVIDELAAVNGCQSDFTHPRQMAVIDRVAQLGDLFFLGHWGDVLFDDMGVRADLRFDEQVTAVIAKIVKRGGRQLAVALWQAWGLSGTFDVYLRERVTELLAAIDLEDANSRIRAFKSMYWAPRWTTVNLAVFASRRSIALPYYHDEMCKFVCTIPERLLAGRQIQIEYMKRKSPRLAKIAWQTFDPFDLYNYRRYYGYRNLPRRVLAKARREIRQTLSGRMLVTRNWEIQFLGARNASRLREHLLENDAFAALVPRDVVDKFYREFRSEDPTSNAHPVSMLLTLSAFARRSKAA